MISDTAAFAGMLAYDLDQPGAARASLTMAADAAHQAGDPALQALAVALQGRLLAQVAPDDRRAGALLDQAYQTLPDHAPAAARAWLAVHHAAGCAATGDRLGYEAGTEVARNARQQPAEPTSGFFSQHGWYHAVTQPHWLDENRARGLAALQDRKAEPLLLSIVEDTGDPRGQANAFNSLASLYAGQNEIDEACRAALRALELAADQQLPSVVRKIRTTRTQMQDHHRTPAV